MSSNNDNVTEIYSDETEKAIYTAGYLGFGIDYLINCIQLDRKEVTNQFLSKEGHYFKIWVHGYYTAKTEIRNTIMSSALSGSTPSLEKMIYYFKELDDELNNIEDE